MDTQITQTGKIKETGKRSSGLNANANEDRSKVANSQSNAPRIGIHNSHNSNAGQSLDTRNIASGTSESSNSVFEELAQLKRLLEEQQKQIQDLQIQVDQAKVGKEAVKRKNDQLEIENEELQRDNRELKKALQQQSGEQASKSQEEYRREAFDQWIKNNPGAEGTEVASMVWRRLQTIQFGPNPILDQGKASEELQESLDVIGVRFRTELEDLLENFIELASQYNEYQKYQDKKSELVALDSYKEDNSFKCSFIARMAQEMPHWIMGYKDKYIYSYSKPYEPVKFEFNQEILSFVETSLEQFRRWTVMIMDSLKEEGAFNCFFNQNDFSKEATEQGFQIVKVIFQCIEFEMPQWKEENERQLQKEQVEDFLSKYSSLTLTRK